MTEIQKLDDIRKRMIRSHTGGKSKITVSQILSKELTQKQNEALKKRINTSGITRTQHLPRVPSMPDDKEEKQSIQVY